MEIRLDEFLKNILLVSIGWKDLLALKSSVKVKSNLDFRSRTRERNKKKGRKRKRSCSMKRQKTMRPLAIQRFHVDGTTRSEGADFPTWLLDHARPVPGKV